LEQIALVLRLCSESWDGVKPDANELPGGDPQQNWSATIAAGDGDARRALRQHSRGTSRQSDADLNHVRLQPPWNVGRGDGQISDISNVVRT
jgi:hypothetical protein